MKLDGMKFALAAATAGLVGSSGVLAQAPAPAAASLQAPVVKLEVTTLSGRVTAIDAAKRLVSVKGSDGRMATLFMGPDVRNFENLKVGDEVTARYTEARSLAIAKGEKGNEAEIGELRVKIEAEAARQASQGGKPGMSVMERTTAVANVFQIDRQRGIVTLRGTSGVPVPVKVADTRLLDQIGLNDQIVIGYRHAAAISIEPGPARGSSAGTAGARSASAPTS